MEEDILKYSPTVMFRGTPCRLVIFFLNPDYPSETEFTVHTQSINTISFSVLDLNFNRIKIIKVLFFLFLFFHLQSVLAPEFSIKFEMNFR